MLLSTRPKQWPKNLFVIAAPFGAGVLFRRGVATSALLATAAFTCASAAVYLMNDVADRDLDRAHPRKRHRPIASGQLSVVAATLAAAALVLTACSLAWFTDPPVTAIIIGYVGLNLSYSLWLHDVPVVDLLLVASGFVLRVLAGSIAAGVSAAGSLLVLACCAALFVVAGKRYSELVGSPERAPWLGRTCGYREPGLRTACDVSAVALVIAYAVWTLQARPHFGVVATISFLPFTLGVVHYRRLVSRGLGDAPEDVFMQDRRFQALLLAWGIVYAVGVYA